MNTEITENRGAERGQVGFDADCRFCARLAARLGPLLARHHFELVPLQTPWVAARLSGSGELLAEMRLLSANGEIFGGAEAVMQIARRIWWAWPLFALSRLPGVMLLANAVYRRVAANHACTNGACAISGRVRFSRSLDWLPLVALPVVVMYGRETVPAWVLMWALAGALFFGCKWLTWRRAVAGRLARRGFLSFAYLFLWVGMEAKEFFTRTVPAVRPKLRAWLLAGLKTVLGAALIYAASNSPLRDTAPLAAGWMGMVGVVLLLHFGAFELLALGWRRLGVNARPLMDCPWRAVSLAEFWGKRWNAAFHTLAHDLAFRPWLRRRGIAGATLGVFLISGLVHELVISLPARGGYGLPTAYFLIQGIGVLAERTPMARRMGLGSGWRGWIFTVLIAAGPAWWLFHPVFIRNVILPMLQTIGAT